MTNNSFDLTALPDAVGDEVPALKFSAVHWFNGRADMEQIGGVNYFGGWRIDPATIAGEQVDTNLFPLTKFTNRERKKYEVYAAQSITVCVVRFMPTWFNDAGKWKRTFNLLGFVDGIAEPVIVQAHGKGASRSLDLAWREAYSALTKAVGATKATFCYRVPFSCKRNAKGEPEFDDVAGKSGEKSPFLQIAAQIPPNFDLANFIAPPVLMQRAMQFKPMADQWVTAQRKYQKQTQVTVNTVTGEIVDEVHAPDWDDMPQSG